MIYWRRLDNQAKIFSLASGRKYTSVFRLSVVLKDNIDLYILEKAVNLALLKYDSFRVKRRRGLFWHYLDKNKKKPKIFLEEEYPFQIVNTWENNNYLFKVSYFKNKINIEFYHILTDGNGGLEFFKEIIYQYIEMKFFKNDDIVDRYIKHNKVENPYKKLIFKNLVKEKKIDSSLFGYQLNGDIFKDGILSISHYNIDCLELKKVCRKYNVTIGTYITAIIGYAIYKKNYINYKGSDIIRISVPVNLKRYFDIDTQFNFFSHISIEINVNKNDDYTFKDILNIVKDEYEKKLNKNHLLNVIYSEEKLLSNPIVRICPLFLKIFFVKIGSLFMKRRFTTSISNIGEIDFDDKYTEYIDKFMVMLSPDWAERVKFGICSYNNNFVISISSYLVENGIENEIYYLLRKDGVNVVVEGNGVKSVVSKKNKVKKKKL